nr:MAG TPA: hypothetical protein [Caudoviricetes sp.]
MSVFSSKICNILRDLYFVSSSLFLDTLICSNS